MLLNLSGIELLSTFFVFTSFTKHEIRKFQVVVGVQRRQGNVLVNETYCFFRSGRFRCRRYLSCLYGGDLRN